MIAQNIQAAERLLGDGAYQECLKLLAVVREELEPHMKKCGLKFEWDNEARILCDIAHLDDGDFEKKATLQNIELVIYNDNGYELADLAEAMFADILVDWNKYCDVTTSLQ